MRMTDRNFIAKGCKMIAPEESGGWTPEKYEVAGFYFAKDDEDFHQKMRGMKYDITRKEPVNLCGIDGFWYSFKAEGL